MVLKLYGIGLSTCTRRVATVLYEKKIPFELVVVDIGKGEHKSAEYIKKQPFGQIPYIVRRLRLFLAEFFFSDL
jgi:glutathione S-transferase